MAAKFALDPLTTQAILENLPAIQKRTRRAKKLRDREKGLLDMMNQEVELGGVTPGSRGALYDIQGTYIPNTYGMAQKAIGGLGSIFADKKAEAEEDELNAARNPEIIRALQQMGAQDQEPRPGAPPAPAPVMPPAAAQMNAALGMPAAPTPPPPGAPAPEGGQPAAPAMPDIPGFETLPPEHQEEIVKAIGSMEGLGMSPEAIGEYKTKAAQKIAAQAAQQPAPQAGPAAEPQAIPGKPPSIEGVSPFKLPEIQAKVAEMEAAGASREEIDMYVTQEIANNAVMPGEEAGPVTITPDTTAQMGSALGLPDQATATIPPPGAPPAGPQPLSDNPTDQTLRAYLGMMGVDPKEIGGGGRRLVSTRETDDGKIYKYFSDGTEEISQGTAKTASRLFRDESTGKINRVFTSGARQGQSEPVMGSDGQPLTMTTDQANAANIETAKVTAKAEAEAATASIAAQTASTIRGAEVQATKAAERREAAKASYSKFAPVMAGMRDSIKRLMTHPALPNITGGMGGRIPDDPKARKIWAAVRGGTPEMEALALHDQITGGTFLAGIQPMIGSGAGQITEAEGAALKAAAARVGSRSQGTPAYQQALTDFHGLLDSIDRRLQADAAGLNEAQPVSGGPLKVKAGYALEP